MRYLSVCSGIEAASVAWHPLGWQAVAFSEIEKFPSAVLAHHYPTVPNWGDMTKFQEWPDADVDVLVGGTPCQSFSVAGLRKGLADPRGNLALTYLALADKYRPQWVVWENVPGVLSSGGGRDFGAFLGGLGQLGYGFAYRVLDAQYFGIAQQRPRVFVVAHSQSRWQDAAAVLFESDSLSRDSQEGGASSKRPSWVLPCFTRRGPGSLREEEAFVIDGERIRHLTPEEMERGLGFPEGYTAIPYPQRHARAKASVEPKTALRPDRGSVSGASHQAAGALRALRKRDEAASCRPRPSDRTGAGDSLPSLQHQAPSSRGHGLGDVGVGLSGGRRIAADGPRYKSLGNSMAVPCMAWIGRRIQMVEDL